jgi:nitrite reductase/ring-hydroxylating ferredoxin subunit
MEGEIFMAKKSIGLVKDLDNAALHGVTIDGKQILVAKTGPSYFAIGNVCTHNGCRLSGGKLEGETVRCPCHGSEFSIKTGDAVHGPAKNPEPVYRVTEEKGELFIDL